MGFWPQQLNFALWCATTGCEYSREFLLNDSDSMNLTPPLRSFYRFHVYFTTRRILYEMGGISSKSALPDDPTFNNQDNRYDIVSYKKKNCAEFGVFPSSDFRYTHCKSHGLGNVFIGMYAQGIQPTDYDYPGRPDLVLFSDKRSKDGDRANELSYVRNIQGEDSQFEHFIPNYAQGLSQPGLLRLNHSIEAFVYCVLGAQVDTRSSIIGTGGRAAEAQSQFLILLEGEIRTPDISKSVSRYQHAIENAKVRLNFAVVPECWLIPSRMILSIGSIVGYSNKLKPATQ